MYSSERSSLHKLHIRSFYWVDTSLLVEGARVAQCVRQLDYLTTHTIISPIRRGFAPCFVNYKKGCTRLAAASDKVYQLLAHGRWFSPGTPASSTTKTGRHDIAEILLKVELNTINQIIKSTGGLLIPDGIVQSRQSFGTDMVYQIYLCLKCLVTK